MPQKYIDMMTNLPSWMPFIGLATGRSPLSTRLIESAIMAFIPIVVAAIWMIPKIETKLESLTATQTIVMQNYSENMRSLTDAVKNNNMHINAMQTDVAVLKNNVAKIESVVDNIDDVANTKVRSVEGRLDSLERDLSRGKK